VGYDVGGMSECVRHGETGYLAPPGDEAEHLRWTLRLVRDAALRRRLGSAARVFVAETFSMDAVGRRYERFYERLMAGEARPPEV
jgi:glycosyltransferase involved in cell wall biosynthesis